MSAEDLARGIIALENVDVRSSIARGDLKSIPLSLSEDESQLLIKVAQENTDSSDFLFAESASYQAVNYVRSRKAEISEEVKANFGPIVARKFASGYAGALVESGCVKSPD